MIPVSHRTWIALWMALQAGAGAAHAVELEPADPAQEAEMTAEDWRERVEQARKRSRAFVDRAKVGPIEESEAEKQLRRRESDDRILNDHTLQKGDIVATSDGFFLFLGDGVGNSRADAFVKVPAGPANSAAR